MDIQQFKNPPKYYREVPFWSWNDDLDLDELRRQIALMDQGGWGGFFMHARVGLRTPYLERQWMNCVRACVDEARVRSLEAWLYDEDKWPSGFAGGLAVAGHPGYRAQYLVCKVENRRVFVAERIATFAAREIDGQLVNICPNDTPNLSDGADRVIQFYPQTMPLGTPKFNDYAYLDLLNPDAVQAFLDSTYEAYAGAVGEAFGEAIPGIFTDEPCFLYHRLTYQPAIPWTDDFPAYFQARNGYDVRPHLPALFFDTAEFHGVRYDYWRTVTERFVESYTRQVYAWCQTHHLKLTGHYMAEDTMLSQIQWCGAIMPHYASMHIPGIDKLGRTINTGTGTVLTLKQLDSVVCQLGKPRALCENYGCSGQNFAHAGRKWIGDWAYVLGINLNNPHLALYSMRGERKRDYPPNFFYQQPWWPESRLIADYFARLSYTLSQGQRVVDILVIHPIGSAWALYRPDASHAVDQLDRTLHQLCLALLQAHRDFHFGDEMLMEHEVEGKGYVVIDEGGPRLAVGKMAYRTVIVPPSVTLSDHTVQLLHEFALAGGLVLAVEPLPTLIDGRPAEGPILPATTRIVTLDTLPKVLDELLPFDVRVPGQPAIWVHHRRIDQADCYFLANIDLDHGAVATVELRGTGYLQRWDPATGETHPLASRHHDGITEIPLDFPSAGSHLLVLHRDQLPNSLAPAFTPVVAEFPLDDVWHVTLGGPNALTLDTCQVQIGETDWTVPIPILKAQDIVSKAGTGTPFSLRFSFDVAVRPATPVYLIMESPQRFDIVVNGQTIGNLDAGWWTDIAFRKVDISAAVSAGQNEIMLKGVFGRDTELESIYVIGSFGVAGRWLGREKTYMGQDFDRYAANFSIVSLPDHVRHTKARRGRDTLDLTAQGLPFFAGRVTLRQYVTIPPFNGRPVLEINNLRAAVAHVHVNQEPIGAIAWPPYRLDISAGVHPGENLVALELVGTLRNLLGPHHLVGGDLDWTGPEQFSDVRRWTDDYLLTPLGFDAVTLKMLESHTAS